MGFLRRDLATLVVDDERELRGAISDELENFCQRVLTASDGHEAFNVLKNQKVDLVISDVRMPNCDGFQLLQMVRAQHLYPPIVLMSGFTDVAVWEVFNAGGEGFYGKPFNLESVLQHLTSITSAQELKWNAPSDQATKSINIAFDNEAQIESAKGFSLGRGGFFLGRVPAGCAKNDLVNFKFETETTQAVFEGEGVIRWVRTSSDDELPEGCGIEFVYLPPASKNVVDRFIQEEKPVPYIPKRNGIVL